MNPPPQEDRIDRALDGRLSPEELAAFQADVIRDPVLRATYVDRVSLHAQLRADRQHLAHLLQSTPPPDHGSSPRSFRLATFAALAAAACIALATVYFFGPRPAVDSTVATIIQAQNTRWGGSSLPTLENARIGHGTLALVEGIATLRFDSGATVTIEAPTRLEIIDAMRCRLLEGSVTAEVPEPAHGFAVDTPDLKVTDLGTRFGVTAGAAGDSHVFVFEGEVKLDQPGGGATRHLTEGKTFHLNSGPAINTSEPARFQWAQEPDGWTAIPTSFGRGQDTFVRRGTAKPAGREPLLMVKHSDLERSRKNERRIYLTFDLSACSPAAVQEAQLILDPEPSGLGFSSMVPDSRFAVYGVTDESLDTWSEDAAQWELAPAATDEGLRPAQTRRVGEFWIPRGGSGAPLTIRSDALAEFVRTKRNGLATFIIVRETGETDPSGLVHAFASKEHPSARPPTLRLR